MKWEAVESSQIAEVGYDRETETLGLRFPPTKKQVAAGQLGSEYHYKHVPQAIHDGLMGAKTNPDYDNSIGKFFGAVIKSHPETYPFYKVEPVITEEVL